MKGSKKNLSRGTAVYAKKSSTTSLQGFVQHLERASEIVRTWPTWKQTILGATSNQNADSMPPTSHRS